MRRVHAVLAVLTALALAGCGLAAAPPAPQAIRIVYIAPPTIHMALAVARERPTTARHIRTSTLDPEPTVRGTVAPEGTTVYIRTPGGGLATIRPRRDGAFAVRTPLRPGRNAYEFIAYRLGSQARTAHVAITWRRSAAAAETPALIRVPAPNPEPAAGSVAPTPAPVGTVTVTAAPLDPIRAPAPPPSGGPGRWIDGFELTEYHPALEAWSTGAAVPAPGLPTPHRIDWLYGAQGLSMQGEGIGLDGRWYHIAALGAGGWLAADGTTPASFSARLRAPFWRIGGFWRNAGGGFTYPLAAGGWSNGTGVAYVPPPAGIAFAPGPAKPLTYLRSIAVDPRVIPLGSFVYIPAYAPVNGGWFEAQDTGGAILGRHIDVFVPPPQSPSDTGGLLTGQQVYVVPPGASLP